MRMTTGLFQTLDKRRHSCLCTYNYTIGDDKEAHKQCSYSQLYTNDKFTVQGQHKQPIYIKFHIHVGSTVNYTPMTSLFMDNIKSLSILDFIYMYCSTLSILSLLQYLP